MNLRFKFIAEINPSVMGGYDGGQARVGMHILDDWNMEVKWKLLRKKITLALAPPALIPKRPQVQRATSFETQLHPEFHYLVSAYTGRAQLIVTIFYC